MDTAILSMIEAFLPKIESFLLKIEAFLSKIESFFLKIESFLLKINASIRMKEGFTLNIIKITYYFTDNTPSLRFYKSKTCQIK